MIECDKCSHNAVCQYKEKADVYNKQLKTWQQEVPSSLPFIFSIKCQYINYTGGIR
jgi:hypothetical protein